MSSSGTSGIVEAGLETDAQIARQAAQLIFSKYVAGIQFDLANGYSTRAQELFDQQLTLIQSDVARWTYQVAPCFEAMLAEACAEPLVVADYNTEAAKSMAIVRMNASMAIKTATECADRNSVGMTIEKIKKIANQEAALATSAVAIAFRREDRDVERQNANIRANRAQLVSIARGSYDGSNKASAALAAQYSGMAAQAGAGLGSSMQAIGASGAGLGDALVKKFFGQTPTTTGAISGTQPDSLINDQVAKWEAKNAAVVQEPMQQQPWSNLPDIVSTDLPIIRGDYEQ